MFTGRSSVSLGPHRDRKTGYVRSAFLISPCPIHGKWALCPSIWCNRTAEVRGSIPLGSTNQAKSRSEEHTSELQSLMRISYAVFCLKKKHNTKTKANTTYHN